MCGEDFLLDVPRTRETPQRNVSSHSVGFSVMEMNAVNGGRFPGGRAKGIWWCNLHRMVLHAAVTLLKVCSTRLGFHCCVQNLRVLGGITWVRVSGGVSKAAFLLQKRTGETRTMCGFFCATLLLPLLFESREISLLAS